MLLALFDAAEDRQITRVIATFGAAPMFFYVFHLYVLKAAYLAAYALHGPNQGEYFGVQGLGSVWLWAAAFAVPLYFPADSPAGSGREGISPGSVTSETLERTAA